MQNPIDAFNSVLHSAFQRGKQAEQIVPAEAASRLRDRGLFDGQNRPEARTDLGVAAPLNSTVRYVRQTVNGR